MGSWNLEELMSGQGTFEGWEDIYRNAIKELRDRRAGTGQLPSYHSTARQFLTSVIGVAWMAQYQIQRISEKMGVDLKVLNNLVKSAEAHGVAVARADGCNSNPGVPREQGLRNSVVTGEAWQYCQHFYTILAGAEGQYNAVANHNWGEYYKRCSAIIESYAILYQSLLVPNRPISGEAVTGIERDETVNPYR